MVGNQKQHRHPKRGIYQTRAKAADFHFLSAYFKQSFIKKLPTGDLLKSRRGQKKLDCLPPAGVYGLNENEFRN